MMSVCVRVCRLMMDWMQRIKKEWAAENDEDEVDYSDF